MGIVLLSFGDLLITLICLRSTGMLEANPIASYLIRTTGSAVVLVAYKALTVGVCVGLLYRLRRHVEGEAAAWCAILILAVLSAQWFAYTRQLDTLGEIELARRSAGGDQWLALD